MPPRFCTLRATCFSLLALAGGLSVAHAQTLWIWANDGSVFSDGANWLNGAPPADDLVTNIGLYNVAGTLVQVSADRSIAGLRFTAAPSTFRKVNNLPAGTTITLTLGAAGIDNQSTSTSNAISFEASLNLKLGAAATFKDAGKLTIASAVNNGGFLLTLDGTGTNGSITGKISGSGGLTKTGTGTWTLSAANDFTGATTVSQGTLRLGNSAALSSGTVTLGGGTLSFGTLTTTALGGLAGSSNLTLTNTSNAAVALTVGSNGASTSYSGALGGLGSLEKVGSGTLTLSGASGYTGATKVTAGILEFNSIANAGVASALGAPAAGNSTVTVDAATLRYTGTGHSTDRAVNLTAAGTIEASGSGLLTLGAAGNSITGSGLNLTLSGTGSGAVSGALALGTGGLTKSGGGTWILNGASTFSGGTTVSAGTLKLGNSTALGSGAVVLNGGSLAFGGTTTATLGSLSGSGGVTLTNDSSAAVALAVGTNGASTSYTGSVSGAGSFEKTGSGTLTLTGTSNYTGATTVSGGVLEFNSSANTGVASALGAPTVGNSAITLGAATLRYTGSSDASTDRGIALTGAGKIESSNARLTFGGAITGAGQNLTLAGTRGGALSGVVATGSGGLTIIDGGLWALSGASTFSGGVTIAKGELRVEASVANNTDGPLGHGTSAIALGDSTTGSSLTGLYLGAANLSFGRDIVVNNTSASGNTVIGGSFTAAGSGTFSGNLALGKSVQLRAEPSATIEFGTGVISGSGGITVVGGGQVTLSGQNTFTGATTISAGTLAFTASAPKNADGALGHATSAVTLNDAGTATTNTALLLGAANLTVGRDIVVANFGTGTTTLGGSFSSGTGLFTGDITLARTTNFRADGSSTVTFQTGAISGAGGIVKTGSGAVELAGANTYAGGTTLSSGSLLVTGSILHSGADLNVAPAAGNGGKLTVSGSGSVTVRSAIFGGGSGASGTLNLTSGTFSAGSVQLGVAAGSTGTLNLGGTSTNQVVLATGQIVVPAAAGQGTITFDGGILRATGDQANFLSGFSPGNVQIQNGGAFLDTGGYAVGISAPLQGAGALTVQNSGTLTLSGANSYAGGTVVNGSTLAVANDSALGAASGGLTLANGGTLNSTASFSATRPVTIEQSGIFTVATGTTLTWNGPIIANNTTTFLTKNGGGTLTLMNDNSTFSGGFGLLDGTLEVGNDHALGTGLLAFAAGTMVASGGARTIANPAYFLSTGMTIGGAQPITFTHMVNTGLEEFINGPPPTGGGVTVTNSARTTFAGGIQLLEAGPAPPGFLPVSFALNVGAGSDVVISGPVTTSGSGGILNKTGAGTLTLSSPSSATAAFMLSEGTTYVGHNDALGFGVILNGGTLAGTDGARTLAVPMLLTNSSTLGGHGDLTFTGALSVQLLAPLNSPADIPVLSVTNTGTTTLGDISTANAPLMLAPTTNLTVLGTISGIGIGVAGSGVTTFKGTNTFSNGLVFDHGTLVVGADANLGAAEGTVTFSGGTLRAAASFTATRGTQILADSATFDTLAGVTLTWNGDITGNGGLTKIGTGTLLLGGTNTYSGPTLVNAGTLRLGSLMAFSPNTTIQVAPGATFDANGFQQPLAGLTGSGNVDVGTHGVAILPSGVNTFDGKLSGAGGITLNGAGTLVLNHENDFQGAVVVTQGTLQLGAAGALPGGAPVTLGAGTTLDLAGHAATLGKLEGAGTVNLGGATLSVAQNTNTEFTGMIQGVGGLTKSDSGTLSLTGMQFYSGTTQINGGEIKLNGMANSPFVLAGGTLSGNAVVSSITIANGGVLSPGNSPGTAYAGDTTWESGGAFCLEINQASGGFAGTNWDLLNVTGALTFSARPEHPFTLQIASLTLANAAGGIADFSSDGDYSFAFVMAIGGIVAFDANAIALDLSRVTNPFNGTWSVSQEGNSLVLHYGGGTPMAAIPEPSTYALGVGLGAFALAAWRRRRARA